MPARTQSHTTAHVLPRDRLLREIRQPTVHQWRDPSFGFTIHSDFDAPGLQPLLESALRDQVLACQSVFDTRNLGRLHLWIFRRAAPTVDGVALTGLHHASDVYVFAGQDGQIDRTALANLRHELVHAFIALAGWHLPRWLEEGLAQALTEVRLDAQGGFHAWMQDDFADWAAQMRGEGSALAMDHFLRFERGYPAADEMGRFYIQAWSFVFFALHNLDGDLAARVARLRDADDRVLQQLAACWQAEGCESGRAQFYLAAASGGDVELQLQVAAALHPATIDAPWWDAMRILAASPHTRVRIEAAELLGRPRQDELWWMAIGKLLTDPAREVQRAAQRCLWRNPAIVADTAEHLRRLTRSADAELRVAAWLALLQNGDLSAEQPFLLEIAAIADPAATFHPLTSLRAVFPSFPFHPSIDQLLGARIDVAAYCRDLATWIEPRRAALVFDAAERRYLVAL